MITPTTRLNSTQLNWNVQNWQKLTKTREPVELSWVGEVIIAPDPTQLNQLSWVELSRVGRYDQAFKQTVT